MLEKALVGSRRYYIWLAFLFVLIAVGVFAYIRQFTEGLALTGMSRDVSWGLYISQFTFIVGTAVSGVMIALLLYLRDKKSFGALMLLGEFLSVAAILVAILFIFVDLGQPARVLNVLLHPSPNSIMFWDMVTLGVFLMLNIFLGWTALAAEKKGLPAPSWIRPLTYVSIFMAIVIHVVAVVLHMAATFIYPEISLYEYFYSVAMAVRFIATAFASGSALLILVCLIVGKISQVKIPDKALQVLAKVACVALIVGIVFYLLQVAIAFSGDMHGHQASLRNLFFDPSCDSGLAIFMYAAIALAVLGIVLLLVPQLRRREEMLVVAAGAIILACWLDKGLASSLGEFMPNSFGQITGYAVSLNEIAIICGVYGIGLLVVSVLYKVVFAVFEGSGTAAAETDETP